MPSRSAAAVALTLVLVACQRPQPPADDQPPEPQARHTQLRDAMRQQIQETKRLQEEARKAHAERDRLLEDAQR